MAGFKKVFLNGFTIGHTYQIVDEDGFVVAYLVEDRYGKETYTYLTDF